MLDKVRAEAPQFLRFAFVGGTGFVVDAAVLCAPPQRLRARPLLRAARLDVRRALTTWRLNRAHTFGASDRSQADEGLRYATVAALAARPELPRLRAGADPLARACRRLSRSSPATGCGDGLLLRSAIRASSFRGARAILGSPSSQSR